MIKKYLAGSAIAALSLSTLSPALASDPIAWDGDTTVTMEDTLNATMFERDVSYQITQGDEGSFVEGTTTVLDLNQNDEYFYRISANSETNNVDKGSVQGLTRLTEAEQESYYQDENYFDYDPNTYQWAWVLFACTVTSPTFKVVSAPTLTIEDVRPPFTTGFEDDDYMDFWVDNPIAGDELLITSQYIRDDELTLENGFDSGDEIFFLPKASDGDTGADPTLALKYSEQRVSGACPGGSSAESLEIVQDGSKVTDRALNLSSGIELERFGTPFEISESLDGYSIAVYGGGVNFYNGVSHFGLTTIGEQTSEQTPAPNPYSGPLITNINNSTGAYETFPGEELKVYGERLSSINKVFINNLQGEVVSTSDDHLVMITPEGLTAGSYDLVVESSIGNLRFLGAFVVTEESANRAIAMTSCEGAETSWWTKRISDSRAKAYIKCPEVGQKYRILQQTGGSGEYDSFYVKTLTDENDQTQVFNEFGRYIVRTIELEDINRIRITVDDEELWKVRYNR